jgi:hypothetical protein
MDLQNTNQSQTKLTTGNSEYDFLLRESLGIMNIGKTVLDLPSTIVSFEQLHQKYLQDLKVLDSIEEELANVNYIRSH